jgi:hypothetical protein
MDMAKLRQDTADRWIELFAPTVRDSTLARVDEMLDERFSESEGYRDHVDPLRAFNLLRAYPYAKDEAFKRHILREVQCLLSF